MLPVNPGPHYFSKVCCGRPRGVLKGVYICGKCDYEHSKATVIPNESLIRDQNPRP